MEVFDLNPDPEKIKAVFQKYFAFKRKQEMRKIPLAPILTVTIVLAAIGEWRGVRSITVISLVLLTAYLATIAIYLMRFQYRANRFIKSMIKQSNNSLLTKRFGFDDQEVYYESEALNMRLKWSYFESYEINNGDIYAYKANKELAEIFSAEAMGEQHFPRFQSTISQKVPLKK